MNLVFLTILLIFIPTLSFFIKRSDKNMAQKEKEFWDKEHDANFTRKKSLDDVNFITIPDDIYSIENSLICPEETELFAKLLKFRDEDNKLANFNGITNTDLKMKYGAANLTKLSEYDKNYSELIITLNSLGVLLYKREEICGAETLLDYATSIGSDISESYTTLASIYISTDRRNLIHLLIKRAEDADSFRSPSIISSLNDLLDSTDPLKSNSHNPAE